MLNSNSLLKSALILTLAFFTNNAYSGTTANLEDIPQTNANYNPGTIPPHAEILGKTYGDWGAEWWKWALSVPISQSPILDTTGEYGSQNQKGQVWFLAGTFGSTAERNIKIPSGKFIFFPIVNMWNDYPCPDPNFKPADGESMTDFLTAGVTPYIDPWITLAENTISAKVDGVELRNLKLYRAVSHLTKFTADPSQIEIDSCINGAEQVGVSDGIWIMLTPLKPGRHVIEFNAFSPITPFPNFYLHVKYNIAVEQSNRSQ